MIDPFISMGNEPSTPLESRENRRRRNSDDNLGRNLAIGTGVAVGIGAIAGAIYAATRDSSSNRESSNRRVQENPMPSGQTSFRANSHPYNNLNRTNSHGYVPDDSDEYNSSDSDESNLFVVS